MAFRLKANKVSLKHIASCTGLSLPSCDRLFKRAKLEPTSSPANPLTPMPLRKTGSGRKNKVTNQKMETMRNTLDKNPKLMTKELKDKLPILHEMDISTIQEMHSQLQMPLRNCSRPNIAEQPLESLKMLADDKKPHSKPGWSAGID